MRSVVLQLGDPKTELAALRRLIKFSGPFLNEGPLFLVTNDPKADELRRAAARAAHSHRNVDSVRHALTNDDQDVRCWGVRGFESTAGKREPWKGLLPRLEEIASHDESPHIRSEAIQKLQGCKDATVFLNTLQEAPNETDPSVLMVLLRFNSRSPDSRARWYARAVKFLSRKDEALRLRWLLVIWGNVSNPRTAPMWKIEADPALVESLRQIERTGSKKERELASQAAQALAMGRRTTAQPNAPPNVASPRR